MALKPLPGFKSMETHHCVTGSMRHVYVYNSHDVSEDMLLGIGAGVSFSYWHFKGQPPFMGGRGGVRPPFMEEVAGQRTGVTIERHTTTSARKARKTLLELLGGGQPVMIQCDMGFLPYFDFGGQDYHFGGHVVVVCGYDPDTEQTLIADRDGAHPVPMEDLEKARGSTHRPFPPKNLWFTLDFSQKRQPTAKEVCQAIQEQAKPMLEPPIRNIGIKGMRKAANAIPKWPSVLDADDLRWTLFNAHIFINADGGTGGGLFRYMLSRFLREAAAIAGDTNLEESADEFQRIGDEWEKLGQWFHQTSELPEPAAVLDECADALNTLANLEEEAWKRLQEIVS